MIPNLPHTQKNIHPESTRRARLLFLKGKDKPQILLRRVGSCRWATPDKKLTLSKEYEWSPCYILRDAETGEKLSFESLAYARIAVNACY